MSNFNPFADIVVPTFATEGLSAAFATINAAFQSSPKGRDTTAASKLAKLIEDARVIGL